MKPAPNPMIAELPRYNAGMNIDLARKLSGKSQIAALASNENAAGCAPGVHALFSSGAFDPSRYPDPACTTLRQAISELTGVGTERIVVGNGSEELIAAISRAYLVEGGHALTVMPSFGLHEIDPLAAGASVEKVAMTPELEFDLPALEAALARRPSVFFLPTPSNPVGCALDMTQLERLVAATSPQTLFVIDEAYFEFQDGVDGARLLGREDFNCVVLRTFSKAYGLAGLRVGYALCASEETAGMLVRAKPPFDVNSAAQQAAVAALQDQSWMRASVERIKAERERVAAALRALDLFAAPSQANFLFVRTVMPSQDLAQSLLMEGVIVKPWKEEGYQDFVRVSIGSPAENDQFLEALKRLVA